MITLRNFMEAVDYRLTESSEFLWGVYGGNAQSLDSWNGDQDGWSAGVVFDRLDQKVYEMFVCDYRNDRAYRWIHPDYRSAHAKEAEERGVDVDIAWDDLRYIDLEVPEDILEKCTAIVEGRDYDTRISVPLDLDDSDLLALCLDAHRQDITLNQHMVNILNRHIEDATRA